jgi:hypothetical protein
MSGEWTCKGPCQIKAASRFCRPKIEGNPGATPYCGCLKRGKSYVRWSSRRGWPQGHANRSAGSGKALLAAVQRRRNRRLVQGFGPHHPEPPQATQICRSDAPRSSRQFAKRSFATTGGGFPRTHNWTGGTKTRTYCRRSVPIRLISHRVQPIRVLHLVLLYLVLLCYKLLSHWWIQFCASNLGV